MTYKCEIVEKPVQPILSLRERISVQDLPRFLGKAYAAVLEYLQELGEQPVGMPFAIYYNMDMQDLDIEAGFPISKQLAVKDDLIASQIPAGKFASCLYIGPYDQCGSAYESLTEFVKQQGYEPSGIAIEYYLNNPRESPYPVPETLIVFPLK